ncbi:hypothetical protein NOK12_28430 [Nocardioides sp. OK12]|nr:hypothetical protein NOK12_28430 [Nocardioides sp. OK12]
MVELRGQARVVQRLPLGAHRLLPGVVGDQLEGVQARHPPILPRHPRATITRMAWFVLVISGVLEAVWATALGRSDGLSRPVPSVVFGVAVVLSMLGLAQAMRTLPVGTAYAVWVGIGASLTVAYAMVTGDEPADLARVALLVGLVGCIVGLKLVS